MIRLLAALVALGAPAVLPLVVALGLRAQTVFLVLPVGALLSTAASVAAVSSRTSFTWWLLAVDVVTNAVALWMLVRRGLPARGGGRAGLSPTRVVVPVAAALTVLAGLSGLTLDSIGWDARSIWLLHARLLHAGGASYGAAIANPAYGFAHMDYPPLVPSAVAAGWQLAGKVDYRVGQVLVALLGGSLLACAGCLVARVARGRWAWGTGALAAVAVVAAGYGAAGITATDGYADLTAAAAATAAAVALLVLPRQRETTAIGVICCWIGGATKSEGLVAVVIIALLFVIRILRAADEGSRRRAVRHVATILLPLAAWPLVVAGQQGRSGSIFGADGATSVHQPMALRLRLTLHALDHVVAFWPWVVVVAAVSAIAARRLRAGERLGPAWLLWTVALAYVAALCATYARGSLEIRYWLGTSVDRVTIFPRLLLAVECSVWALLAANALANRPVHPPATEPEPLPERRVLT